MGVDFLVTLAAIMEYLGKARDAQEKLNEASEQMNKAATELCSKWKGDAAIAFAQEQEVLYGYCKQLYAAGDEYIRGFEKAHTDYSDADERARAAIKG